MKVPDIQHTIRGFQDQAKDWSSGKKFREGADLRELWRLQSEIREMARKSEAAPYQKHLSHIDGALCDAVRLYSADILSNLKQQVARAHSLPPQEVYQLIDKVDKLTIDPACGDTVTRMELAAERSKLESILRGRPWQTPEMPARSQLEQNLERQGAYGHTQPNLYPSLHSFTQKADSPPPLPYAPTSSNYNPSLRSMTETAHASSHHQVPRAEYNPSLHSMTQKANSPTYAVPSHPASYDPSLHSMTQSASSFDPNWLTSYEYLPGESHLLGLIRSPMRFKGYRKDERGNAKLVLESREDDDNWNEILKAYPRRSAFS